MAVEGRPVVVSVKSGKVTVRDVRDLRGVLERESAVVGALITLYHPTKPMLREAATAGSYEAATGLVPRLQILTIAQLLDANSHRIVYPPPDSALTRPQRERGKTDGQFRLPLVAAIPGGRPSELPRQEVPSAAPPPFAARRLGRAIRNYQLALEKVEDAVPWQLARQRPRKAGGRRPRHRRAG